MLPTLRGLAGLAAVALAGCGADPAARVLRTRPQFAADAAMALREWNAADARALVGHQEAAGGVGGAAQIERLAQLRATLGRVTQHGEGLIDPLTGDARIYAVGHHVVATEHGVARVRIAYDRDLRIVDFGVDGRPHGQR